MGLYIDEIENYKDYVVLITNSKANIRLMGLIDDEEFSYSSGANWGSSGAAGAIEGAVNGAASNIAKKWAGEAAGNYVSNELKTILSTYKGYEGEAGVPLSVSMHLFPNRFGNGSYKDMELQLAKLTQPDTDNALGTLKSYLYDAVDTGTIAIGNDPFKNQLVHVSIGEWFLATGLTCDNVGRSYSKYVDDTGKPISLVVSFSFSPYKSLDAIELSSWIRK